MRSAEGFILSTGILPRATIGGFATDRGRYTSPATACAVYPFVYLRKPNTLLRKLFIFHKFYIRYTGGDTHSHLGSIDFRAAARSVLLIGRVKREPNVRVIIHDKSSLAPEGKPVAFCLDPETGFEWIGEYDITADELLSGAGGNNATKTEQAEKLILDLLADGKELASEDIEKAAADAGISARTVRAAKKNLDGRITSKRIGAAWYHALKK